MKTTLTIAAALAVGAAGGWFGHSFFSGRYEFRQLKRGEIEVMYRVDNHTGQVQYVASATDSQRAPGSEWKDVGSFEEVFGAKSEQR